MENYLVWLIESLPRDQIFIRKLTEIIQANLGNENYSIKELAHELGISRYSLSRRLYETTNRTFKHFIREARLQKAFQMLQNEELTVSEIAYKVGFSSPAYFNTCFHEFFGYPPGQVKRTSANNTKETKPVQVKSKHKQNRSSNRTLIYISSGILLLSVIVFQSYSLFFKHPDARPGNSTVKDIDGNIYHTVTIGTQIWLAEDLKTTRYNDGNPIPCVVDTAEWGTLHSGAYCWANNDESNKSVYGALYNWYTTNNGKLCPLGWHVSSNSDWETLINYCGGWEIAGGKLKEAGTAHWKAPNVGATNEFGFTALPAGGRGCNGKFSILGVDLGYWCPPRCGDFRSLCSDRTWIYLTESVACEACCVRCVKN